MSRKGPAVRRNQPFVFDFEHPLPPCIAGRDTGYFLGPTKPEKK